MAQNDISLRFQASRAMLQPSRATTCCLQTCARRSRARTCTLLIISQARDLHAHVSRALNLLFSSWSPHVSQRQPLFLLVQLLLAKCPHVSSDVSQLLLQPIHTQRVVYVGHCCWPLNFSPPLHA